jgi:hypothetical protein
MISTDDRQQRALVSLAYPILMWLKLETRKIDAPFLDNNDGTFSFDVTSPVVMALAGMKNALKDAIIRDPKVLTVQTFRKENLLYLSCRSGYVDVTEMLLKNGFALNAIQCTGSTVLHVVCYYGHLPLVTLLLLCGTDCSIKNKYGHTAEDEAATSQIRSAINDMKGKIGPSSIIPELGKIPKIAGPMQTIEHGGEIVGFRILRIQPNRDDVRRLKYKRGWHGTKKCHVQSIFKFGLKSPGTTVDGVKIKVPPGHIGVGKTIDGVKDWASAVFASPSIAYSCHLAYSERFNQDNQEWCILIDIAIKPGTFTEHSSTVAVYIPLDGEPDSPEMRVAEVTSSIKESDAASDAELLLRVAEDSNIMVMAVTFAQADFISNTELSFDEVQNLMESK